MARKKKDDKWVDAAIGVGNWCLGNILSEETV